MNAYLPGSVKIKCPYCGFINTIRVEYDRSTSRPQAIYCCSVEGGCDRLFAAKLVASIRQEVYIMTEVEA